MDQTQDVALRTLPVELVARDAGRSKFDIFCKGIFALVHVVMDADMNERFTLDASRCRILGDGHSSLNHGHSHRTFVWVNLTHISHTQHF